MRLKAFVFYVLLTGGLILSPIANRVCTVFAADGDAAKNEISVDISYKSSFETLYDSSSEILYILIENTSQNPVVLKDIKAITPKYIISKDINKRYINYRIYPENTAVIPVDINSRDAVKPGKDVLLYNIELVSQTKSKNISFNKILAVDINMGITTSNDILTLLGVPSLIFIPGLIILVIFSSFLKKNFGFLEKLDIKNPLFWVIGISIGLLVTYLYPWISDMLGKQNHNLLTNYGLTDIVTIWLSSVIFALILSIAVRAVMDSIKNRKLFFETDDPFTIIKKVSRFQNSFKLQKVIIPVFGEESQMYLLPENGSGSMLCPVILVEVNWDKVKSSDLRKKLSDKLKEIIVKDKNIGELADYIRKNRRKINVKWKDGSIEKIIKSQGEFNEVGEYSLVEYK